jgi:hypothetical protein
MGALLGTLIFDPSSLSEKSVLAVGKEAESHSRCSWYSETKGVAELQSDGGVNDISTCSSAIGLSS